MLDNLLIVIYSGGMMSVVNQIVVNQIMEV
jgi:hypothetical protein